MAALGRVDNELSKDEIIVYSLQLQDNGSPNRDKTLVRLPPPVTSYILRIQLDAGTTASRNGVLYTNFPLDKSKYERARFIETKLPQDFTKPFQIDLVITTAGAFEYYIEHDGPKGERVRCQSGYFIVDPALTVPRRTRILGDDMQPLPVGQGGTVTKQLANLPLDGLVIQSVIAKWMGTLDEWVPHLDQMRDRGYNMLHYTPLQQRGESGSPYSIFDQLEFDDVLFKTKTSRQDKNEKMRTWLKRIKEEWGMLGMMDVVLNHTANNSEWLQDHPEAGYNVINSPHLESAVELDTALLEFSKSLESRGLPTELKSSADLDKIMDIVKNEVVPSLKLYEYYVIDVKRQADAFAQRWSSSKASTANGSAANLSSLGPKDLAEAFARKCLPSNYKHLGARYHAQLDVDATVAFIAELTGLNPGQDTAEQARKKVADILDIINVPLYETYDDDLKAILDNTRNRAKFTRLDDHGPKYGPITESLPFAEPLFTRLPKNTKTSKHDPRSLALANNGWIWDADPLVNFAGPESRTYIRRDLIVWGDCVKLNYGEGPKSNPWLWQHMTNYVVTLAKMFDGFRLDNAHSTPIVVGELLLDAARQVNPHLYVCAELFTGSQELDMHFVCRLGLNSLIREAMNSNTPKEESGLLYGFGLGKPIGAMDTDCMSQLSTVKLEGKTRPCKIVPLAGSKPHAFLMDCTHDNESPLSKRTAEDALATGALVTFARAAVGSNRGFDDLYPHLLNVVSETRKYEVTPVDSAIGGIKRLLNHLHTELVLDDGVEGHFSEEGEYITAHRVNPVTHKGYLLVARTAFSQGGNKAKGDVAPIRLDGTNVKYIGGAQIQINSAESRDTKDTLKGLDATVTEPSKPSTSVKKVQDGVAYSEIVVPDTFPPGSVLVFATWMDQLPDDLDAVCAQDASEAFGELDMVELNTVLYRADGEERDAVGGDGVYHIPGMSPLVYCGLQGWMHPLTHIMKHNDLGHPLCGHLRAGTWAFDYVCSRLEKQFDTFPRLKKPAAWFQKRFDLVKKHVPPFLRPKYFAMIINVAYKASRDRALSQCAPLVKEGTSFTAALGLTAVQMLGQVKSASLDPFKTTPSLAAGLPHFTAGWARTWGRDVFISLRGLFLVTGQFAAAREHILAFSSVLKHGLVPNLLDSGKTPRYNCRDGPWFMLQNIQDYVNMAPNGLELLRDKVKRRFPLNDEWVPHDSPKAYQVESTVAEVVQEVLQRHAQGIHFREYNAGPNLDMQMSDPGFNIDIDVDWKTGIIYGGNEHNCGTWQDKMGESGKAGNKGRPGTPRDGAPVEIIGLLKSALRWVDELSAQGHFPFKGVEATVDGQKKTVTYKEWAELIQNSFERLFYVPADAKDDDKYSVKPELIARRGIYKDVQGTPAERARADYQLRGNFPIAMSVAPELFDPEHALGALKVYEDVLVGPLGVATLDPSDPDYRGYYDNSNDSDDYHVAKGWNYHQGPEWVWPLGFYLRALLKFDLKAGEGAKDPNATYHHIHRLLAQHRQHIQQDPWAGLPELTQKGGQHCPDSCNTQAWSTSTLLDVLDDISREQQKR
ncbi:bifunctional 4-alpha-glucanotransferase/amylo-alpha-1,6-glucosidase [Microbotryomycetes sp. JL221]|nr:bifunctional 4-alpha-glucanotransferase/amylo-alpha-1,6-glucosidase [Microbotryomycetes sp. JL221]